MPQRRLGIQCAVVLIALLRYGAAGSADTLPSWHDGPIKTAIVDFVARVTRTQSLEFVPPERRIAVFDNDGTLWAEQPIYFQLAYAVDAVKVLAPQHPEWNNRPPFKAVLAGDLEAITALREEDVLELITVSHAGMTTDAFAGSVRSWLKHARHPRYDRRYTELVYQPMLELLAYLRANGFKTFIVSGGGVDFMRVFAEEVYGIPPEQVIGSSAATKLEYSPTGEPVLVKQSRLEFIDDGPGKPAGIHRFIGRKPILAFGNSDGDLQMLQWTATGTGARFVGLIHHTDAKREYAYDRDSRIGRLDQALEEAKRRQWSIVDMRSQWRSVFPASSAEKVPR